MYNYIKGTYVFAGENYVVIEAGGIGYELYASGDTIQKLGRIGDECKVYCYLNVKEDEMSLFGFATQSEKDFFIKLINVSGIGCRMAISILGSGNLSDIITAITTADVGKLGKIKGIGKKTAERIVVELRDKLAPGSESIFANSAQVGATVPVDSEAVEALMSLGYTRQEATAAVSRVKKDGLGTEEIVLAALKG